MSIIQGFLPVIPQGVCLLFSCYVDDGAREDTVFYSAGSQPE